MLELQVREITLDRCFELVVPSDEGVAQLRSELAGGQALALHFAPGRWLLPEPSVDLIRALEASSVATLVDVQGKYRRILIGGSGAGAALTSSIALDSVLAGRDCAAAALFDCPTIIVRHASASGERYEIWVHASYLASFLTALADAGRRVQSRPQQK